MAKIIFWALDAPGHVNPALALAKRLAARGHHVGFVVGSTTRAEILAHGFECQPPPFDAYSGPLAPHTSMTDVMDIIRGFSADLILCDVLKSVEALAAKLAGYRVAFYSVTLPLWSDRTGPSVFSSLPAPTNMPGRAAVKLSWFVNSVRQRRNRRLIINRSSGYRIVCDFIKSACDRLGFHGSAVNWNTNTGVPLPYFPSIPTLIMCPRELDFARADAERLFWIDPCILRERPAAPPPPPIDDKRPLIFASLGTQAGGTSKASRWFESVCDAVLSRPEWQAIVAVGPQLFPGLKVRSRHDHVTIVETVAQHKALERAMVAAIHGGLNSVKECIMAEVPMAMFPVGVDQPGTAERVRTRGLGMVGRLEDGPTTIVSMLDNLLYDRARRDRLRSVASKWRRLESEDIGARVVESFLG